ncbi:4-alpha-glucanotransferase [Marmoricola sp. OAE513]|uniref:4-alpha-glucanotransferase n=1 Tax=Marmoricola sp. OAE513 TaxID=2817894 RepID=UPI001AE21691
MTRPGRDPGLGDLDVVCEDGSTRRVAGRLPADFPLGYHRARTGAGTERALIVSPGRCFVPEEQTWGWSVQLYATRSSDSWGIGDLRDLRRLRKWTAGVGGGFLLVNPLHAVAPSGVQESSPYLPTSRRFLNPLYLCVPEVPGFDPADADTEALDRVRAAELIDRDGVAAVKLSALRSAFERSRHDADDFNTWRVERGQDVEDYALWCALAERHGTDWHTWPEGVRDPSGPAVPAAREDLAENIDFHVWLQWQLSVQLRSATGDLTIIQDLPVGVAGSGADAWTWQELLARDVSIGAPPDELNSLGQDWGSPPWVPWRLQDVDYEPFIQTVRRTVSGAGGLRIDHVMGLFRLWWVPGGGDPTAGGYVRYPHDDLLDIVALESHRARAVVVGEDLGTVEEGVADALAERGILSYKVLLFEEQDPAAWPERSMAAVTTHDLPTVTGLCSGSDAEEQARLTGIDPAEIESNRQALLATLHSTGSSSLGADPVVDAYARLVQAPSLLLCLSLEDAVGQERRPNVPGTVADRNWSIPLPVLIDDLPEDPGTVWLIRLAAGA